MFLTLLLNHYLADGHPTSYQAHRTLRGLQPSYESTYEKVHKPSFVRLRGLVQTPEPDFFHVEQFDVGSPYPRQREQIWADVGRVGLIRIDIQPLGVVFGVRNMNSNSACYHVTHFKIERS